MKTIAFFNNKGGVGKTTLTYHLAWMLHHLGVRVVVADLDPQANLTAAFLDDETIEARWSASPPRTVFGALAPLIERLGDVGQPAVEEIDGIGLVVGDLSLSAFEDRLAQAWPACLDDNAANARDAFRVTTAFHRLVKAAAESRGAEIVLLDVGPNLGALNRAALVAADAVVVPLAADLFSLRGLRNLGPALREWREGWRSRQARPHAQGLSLPSGAMDPIGYVVLQHAAKKANEPARAYHRWIDRFPGAFHEELLGDRPPLGPDPYQLALLRHYRSLLPLSLEARKPVFDLKAADGAIGSHAATAKDAYAAFEHLARTIAGRAGVSLPAAMLF
ncbi:MAG: AAA family ATPase [Deltaproteobacteria bacterium]|nr:AAA family ATPase [Deltaproteobacteria bacterium]